MKTFLEYADDAIEFFRQKGIDFGDRPPRIRTDGSPNSKFDVFIPTGHYDWTRDEITVMTGGRQAKDVMRTLCHELIHAWQFRRDGEKYRSLDKTGNLEDNGELMEYEREAYEKGNLLFRMWTEARS